MADVKVSGLPSDTSLDGNHYVPLNDPTGPTTKRTLLSTLAAFFFNQTNIPAGTGSPVTRADEMAYDFVYSGMVWSADSIGSTRNGSMTSGTIYINGRRLSISAVSARSFTASKDTYVDLLDNLDGTGTLVYTEVANGATAPSLASNSVRIAMLVTGASAITAVWDRAPRNPDELGRVTLLAFSGTAPSSFSLGNFSTKKYLRMIINYTDNSSSSGIDLNFNGDTGSNYSRKRSLDFAAGADSASQTIAEIAGNYKGNAVIFIDLLNILAKEKVFSAWWLSAQLTGSAGGAQAPGGALYYEKWANTSAQITLIKVDHRGTALAVDSGIILKGWD